MRNWTGVMKSIMQLQTLLFSSGTPLRTHDGLNFTQEKALLAIYDNPKKSQKEVTFYLNLDKGAVSKIINTLVEKGYVERFPSPNDRRITLLDLTISGEKETLKIRKKFSKHIEEVLSSLPEDRKQELYDHLNQVVKITEEIIDN